jgi:hypothetical protein
MNACGSLHAATLELTKGTSLKQRLSVAFSKYLRDLDATDLPAPLQEEFRAIIQGLETVRPLPGESAVQATVRKMSAEQADVFAARIVDLFGKVARATASAPRAAEAAPLNNFRERGDARHMVPLLYAAEA